MSNISLSIDSIRNSIFAIEQELGLLPSSVYKDVRTRLDVLEARLRAVAEEQEQELGRIDISKDGVLVAHQMSNINFGGDVSVVQTGTNQVTVTVEGGGNAQSFNFLANCPSTMSIGDLAYISGSMSNGIYQVDKVDITNYNKMPAIGIVTDKSASTVCSVMTLGTFNSVDLTPGTKYYVGINGRIASSPPSAQNNNTPLFIQIVGIGMDTTKLLFQPSFNVSKTIPWG
jgi:hypothetical protein